MTKKQKKVLIRIIISAVLMIALRIAYKFIGMPEDDGSAVADAGWFIKEPFWFIAYMVPYGIIGYDILKKAFKGNSRPEVVPG